MNIFTDKHGRNIEYMRVSVTDRCNLRCVYCMPPDGVKKLDCQELLNYEEMTNIIEAGAELGLKKIRFTGGEPLVRKDFVNLVEKINQIDSIEELSMTTNGVLLKEYAGQLKEAGLDRVNISLDTLDRDKFKKVTRGGDIADVFAGLETARKEELHPIKLNVVIRRGFNDEEILEFAKLSHREELEIRFIEFMPIGESSEWEQNFVSIDEIKERCKEYGKLLETSSAKGSGPAKYYRFKGSKGSLGFISPVSEHFCDKCNRLRLTSDGKIKNCLFSREEYDLKTFSYSENDIKKVLKEAVNEKPYKHQINNGENGGKRNMMQIGG